MDVKNLTIWREEKILVRKYISHQQIPKSSDGRNVDIEGTADLEENEEYIIENYRKGKFLLSSDRKLRRIMPYS